MNKTEKIVIYVLLFLAIFISTANLLNQQKPQENLTMQEVKDYLKTPQFLIETYNGLNTLIQQAQQQQAQQQTQ
jgi:hypothetical protein